ncbi:NUDIX hydrolase [Glycomyces salinus]|uniref:NUDIX hydrolase n=1 Tax=Glycomyces salinus TaxID=980294 RepID=UPI0018EE37BD|nr:NUDIX hydrolase [Glycomyces salinus]
MTSTRWTIHGERIVDDSRRATWSIADVELPDGVRFEQYVYRAPKAAMTLLVEGGAVLLMRRHRFVIDQWVWELPGGYCDDGEDIASCAAREVEEETGWRPTTLEPLVTFQPWVATADAENHLFVSYGAEQVAETPSDINEAQELRWIPLEEVPKMIAAGEIIGSASIIGLQAVMLQRSQTHSDR